MREGGTEVEKENGSTRNDKVAAQKTYLVPTIEASDVGVLCGEGLTSCGGRISKQAVNGKGRRDLELREAASSVKICEPPVKPWLVCAQRAASAPSGRRPSHWKMLRSHAVHGRVIVHADLDCFYCQVS